MKWFITLALVVALIAPANAAVKTGDEFLVNQITTNSQFFSDVATLENGNVVFVWSDDSQSPDDDEGSAIRAQIMTPNGDLLANDLLINSTIIGNQNGPRVAALKTTTGSNGGFVVTFSDDSKQGLDTSASGIRARLFDESGNPLGVDFVVNTITYSTQTRPDVAALDNGQFVIVWEDWIGMSTGKGPGDDTSNEAVRAQIYDNSGKTIGINFLVNTTTKGSQKNPDIAALPNGEFVVAWEDFSILYSGLEIRAQRFDKMGGKLGLEIPVNNTIYGADTDPSVEGFSDGGFVIAWTKGQPWIPNDQKAMLRAFKPNGDPYTDETLTHSVNLATNKGSSSVNATSGNELIALTSGLSSVGADTSENSIWARKLSSGGSFLGGSFLVNATSNLQQRNPLGSTLPDGRVVVAWRDSSLSPDDPSGDAVRGCIIDPALEQTCTIPPVPANLTLSKNLIGCTEETGTGLLECDFEISLTADVTITGNDLTIADVTNMPIANLKSDFNGLNSTDCPTTTINTQTPGLTYIGLTAPAYIVDACKSPAPFKIEKGKPFIIASTLKIDPALVTAKPPQNCVISQADDLLDYMTDPILYSCADVPVCYPAPKPMEYWARIDTSVLEPDAVGNLVPTSKFKASLVPTTIPGHVGKALSLEADGWLQYKAINPSPFGFRRDSSNLGVSGDFSVDFWIKLDPHSGRAAIFDTRRVNTTGNGVLISSQNGNIHFQMHDHIGQKADWVATPASGKIADSKWHHVAVTVDRDNPQGGVIYVDGKPVTIAGGGKHQYFDPTPFLKSPLGGNNPLGIGRNRVNGENNFAFEIDEIEIFHRVLSPTEIAGLFAWPKCK